MMEKRELTCIGCPLGCSITVTLNGKEVTSVTRKHLQPRCHLCKKRSDRSDAHRHLVRPRDRRHRAHGIGKDQRRHSKIHDL